MITYYKMLSSPIISRQVENHFQDILPYSMAEFVLNEDENYTSDKKYNSSHITELPHVNIFKINNKPENISLQTKLPIINNTSPMVSPDSKKNIKIYLREALNKLNDIANVSEIIYLDTRDIKQKYKYLKDNTYRQELEQIVSDYRTDSGLRAYLYFSVNKKFGGFSICVSKTKNHNNIQLYPDAYKIKKNSTVMTSNGKTYTVNNPSKFDEFIKQYCTEN